MKKKSKISGYNLRGTIAALLLSCVTIGLSSAINVTNHTPEPSASEHNTAFGVNAHEGAASAEASAIQRNSTLTFADRVAYQRAIEEVYWRHRIWPTERPDPKPPLDAVMPQAQLEEKVEDYLRNSEALEGYWQRPMSSEQLQAEMDRMAQHTRQPDVLRELFEALGNDPFVIAECLARPALAERFANGDPVAVGVPPAHPTRMPPQKPTLAGWLAKSGTQAAVTMAAGTADYTLPEILSSLDNSSPPDPCTDNTWTRTSLTNAPAARWDHSAVWTGSEMIVWGGSNASDYLNTGGRYNPSTDSWAATSISGAPSARIFPTAVWTGNEMIVWGGSNFSTAFNTGGRYNPGTDSWTATSTTGAPSARGGHTAVWSGSEMIVWGGYGSSGLNNTGGRYNPSTNSWAATSTTGAPSARELHTAVWTGSRMIIWGGVVFDQNDVAHFFDTGGRYNPSTNSWTATGTTGAPVARYDHTAVWTGSEMIVWGGGYDSNGGFYNTGGRYNPSTNSWTATSTTGAPLARIFHTAVWTGSQMIVWGGETGNGFGDLNTGGRYNPSANSWTATSTTGAPTARNAHTAVWTGSQMVVWGGGNQFLGYLNSGGRYCAATAPSAPIAEPATYVASYSFTANWSRVSGATGYRLDVSTSSSFSTYVTGYENLNVGNATSRSVTGLNASTRYYFRVRAYNGVGTSASSNTAHVTTLSPTGPPVVITNPASYIASFSARLNGSVDPHGLTTTVYFQYGTTTSYGLTTAIQSKTGNTYQSVSAPIGSLTPSTTYHFRIVAVNSNGTRYGSDRTFTTLSATGPPVAITNPATNVASSSATLNGSVDPHGLTTNVHFQYGTTTSYGHATANQTKTGNAYQNVAANISGLSASTTYHFRIVATNSAGTRYGGDRTFTTP
jgi:N-acetylneuraminic acid mutarotase